MLKFIIILLTIISASSENINGPCDSKRGICLDSGQCKSVGGTAYFDNCPNDLSNVKCCENIPCKSDDGRNGTCAFSTECNGESVSGNCPGESDFKCCIGGSGPAVDLFFGLCIAGGGSRIKFQTIGCDTYVQNSLCPGGKHVGCCVAGNRPIFYINLLEHTKPACIIGGKYKSVANSGSGIACLAMAIFVTTREKLDPTDLFKEAYKNGKYSGNGFTHDAISFVGKNHGVKINWTDDVETVFDELLHGKGVIFNIGSNKKYKFKRGGQYIFLKGAKIDHGLKQVFVFDPDIKNNYVNVLFPLKSSDGGIEVAKIGLGADFGIVYKN